MNEKQHIPAGYKLSPLGPIPEDWEVKRLGEIGDFSKGNGVPKDKIIKDEHGHPCLTYGDLYTKYDFVIKDIKSFIDNDVASESKEIHIGDICFAGSGETPEDIGKCAAYIEERTAFAGGDIIILSPNKGINSIWLSYVLNSDIGGKQRYKSAQGFSIVHIYPDNLKRIQIPTPTLKEQRRIVSVLSLWDTAIAKQTALIEKLTLRKRGLMQQLLTGKKRLKGFEGEWEKIKFKEIFQRKTQTVNDSSNIQVLSVTKEGIVPQKEYFNKEIASDDTSKYLLVEKGDLAMSGLNFWMGSCHILTQYKKGIISPAYKVFSIRDGFSIEYIVNFVQSYHFKSSLLGSSVIGASIVRRNLDLEMLEEWTYSLPSLPEQKAISDILTYADKEIEIQKQKLAAMQAQKKGLMQVLLTGKRRIL
ncbi:MAG: restriction endonuclease subunit S [Bacteroidales bacterium]|nr:restriction endonuclease subunit S [Bacteroidales bacterium]